MNLPEKIRDAEKTIPMRVREDTYRILAEMAQKMPGKMSGPELGQEFLEAMIEMANTPHEQRTVPKICEHLDSSKTPTTKFVINPSHGNLNESATDAAGRAALQRAMAPSPEPSPEALAPSVKAFRQAKRAPKH